MTELLHSSCAIAFVVCVRVNIQLPLTLLQQTNIWLRATHELWKRTYIKGAKGS